eukprot:CAMPEP_0184861702 /NCGR_PEP_ID=MMETSP0580-20130426/6320_1 /TAXON_ID=1118495 /ORGANISM="Dactyliosolen fragilissimus" /LENGTH=811 /DNA_ID=CAMNT_0027359289 /DNA_START=195 /DNA_END=2630 /DNA_ORIENTATION=+
MRTQWKNHPRRYTLTVIASLAVWTSILDILPHFHRYHHDDDDDNDEFNNKRYHNRNGNYHERMMVASAMEMNDSENYDDGECGLYVGLSSTDAGEEEGVLSMYAGRNMEVGDIVGIPEIGIPVIDLQSHVLLSQSQRQSQRQRQRQRQRNHRHHGESSSVIEPDFFDEIVNFMWTPHFTGAIFEIDINGHDQSEEDEEEEKNDQSDNDSGNSDSNMRQIQMHIPGVGGLGVEHPSIVSADWDEFESLMTLDEDLLGSLSQSSSSTSSSQLYTSSSMYTQSHPGIGAFSHYRNAVLKTITDIPEGSEIFVSYGTETNYDELPAMKSTDYHDIDNFLQQIQNFLHAQQPLISSSTQRQNIIDYLLQHVMPHISTPSLSQDTERTNKDQAKSLIADAFPKNHEQFDEFMSHSKYHSSFHHSHPHLLKSKQWLHHNAQCADNIMSAKSTIPFAGRGAFAKRIISKGQLVAPMPLLKINDKQWMDMDMDMDMYTDTYTTDTDVNDSNTLPHKQILLNYCFSHPLSSVLLCPYGIGTNYINHKPTTQGANAKVVWTKARYLNPHMLHAESITNLQQYPATGLGFDLIATQDIQIGDEIFIDYGDSWQQSWNDYVHQWNTIHNHTDTDIINNNSHLPKHIKASQMNHDSEHKYHPFLTIQEIENAIHDSNPIQYPSTVMTVCHVVLLQATTHDDDDDDDNDVDQNNDSSYSTNMNDMVLYDFDNSFPDGQIIHWKNRYRCEILKRQKKDNKDDEQLYTARVIPRKRKVKPVLARNIPERFIRYVDKPYTSDVHTRGTFRHPIHIPNNIFPQQWKDLEE